MTVVPLPLGIKRITTESSRDAVVLRGRVEVAGNPIEVLSLCNEVSNYIECGALSEDLDTLLEMLDEVMDHYIVAEVSIGSARMVLSAVVGFDSETLAPKIAARINGMNAILYAPMLRLEDLPARKLYSVPLPYATKMPRTSDTTTIVIDAGNRKAVVYSDSARGFYIVIDGTSIAEKGIVEIYSAPSNDTRIHVFVPLEIARIDRHVLELL